MGGSLERITEMDKWAQVIIDSLPWQYKKKAFDGWWREFNYHYDEEEVSYKKINKGRFAANTRLRRFQERLKEKGLV